MIISASRRTDLPAYYSEWFMNRVRARHCLVPNPFNRMQVSRVSLDPNDVDAIVFWTRNPRPLLAHLSELDDRGYRYYFLVTLMANPRQIDPGCPPVESAIQNFRRLADGIGPERVIWRYDPIFLSTATDPGFHLKAYDHIAQALKGYTYRSVVSLVHVYRKMRRRVGGLAAKGIELLPHQEETLSAMMLSLAEKATMNGMEIQSCADELNLQRYGIEPGKCVDDDLISRVLEVNLEVRKDPCQRVQCGCVASKDIGMYDSCPSGCVYCYAVTDFERARANHQAHNPEAPSLLG